MVISINYLFFSTLITSVFEIVSSSSRGLVAKVGLAKKMRNEFKSCSRPQSCMTEVIREFLSNQANAGMLP